MLLAAEMINQGVSGSFFEVLLNTGVKMAIGSLVAGLCAVIGGYACATLTARIGKDMRVALYEKSLKPTGSKAFSNAMIAWPPRNHDHP